MFLPSLLKFKSHLLFKLFTECTSAIFLGKFFEEVAILLRRTCDIGWFPYVCSRESRNGCLRPVIFWSGLSILFSSLQFYFSWPCTILRICMKSPLSRLVFRSVKSSFSSLSSRGWWCGSFVRIALRWTLSNVFESYSRCGFLIKRILAVARRIVFLSFFNIINWVFF